MTIFCPENTCETNLMLWQRCCQAADLICPPAYSLTTVYGSRQHEVLVSPSHWQRKLEFVTVILKSLCLSQAWKRSWSNKRAADKSCLIDSNLSTRLSKCDVADTGVMECRDMIQSGWTPTELPAQQDLLPSSPWECLQVFQGTLGYQLDQGWALSCAWNWVNAIPEANTDGKVQRCKRFRMSSLSSGSPGAARASFGPCRAFSGAPVSGNTVGELWDGSARGDLISEMLWTSGQHERNHLLPEPGKRHRYI